ncbi:hypothetical protein [Legionella bozemanae]|uniref:hypothetical protein n=1 Tax=Legionella bozemanae TaxID=447 RepID=UPI00104120CC|nr:hypothetical protein [Legionella bozemanae]
MTITDQILLKIKILLDSDFKHYVKRDIYFNRETKKIFSREFVRYNSEKVIKDKLQEKNNTEGWQIYFNAYDREEIMALITELDNGSSVKK